jgi:hypothetical protein
MIIRWLSRKTITRAYYSIAKVFAALHGVSRYDGPPRRSIGSTLSNPFEEADGPGLTELACERMTHE